MTARPRKKTRAHEKPLAEYARKRDFGRTPEPEPGASAPRRVGKAKRAHPPPPHPPAGEAVGTARPSDKLTTAPAGSGLSLPSGRPEAGPVGPARRQPLPTLQKEGREVAAGAFVVQKHAARRVHYDLRLELDGVLKSWAVTRGPSLRLGEKRLAVRTEDHPIEYLDFEGNIPKGEYGGGSMIVWDHGRWTPEGDPHRGLAKGHLAFWLDGARLKGKWHLARMRPRRGEKTEPWLLIKSDDEFARKAGDPEITDEETTSRISGRTNEELAAAGTLRADHEQRAATARARKRLLPDAGKVPGARKGLLPAFLEPSLASPCGKPPSGPKWIHEIKHDGYRIQARINGRETRLLTRKALDWTARFRTIADALGELGLASALIDGEIVVEDEKGISSLNNLQADLKTGRRDRFRYYVFDLLYCEGYDLTQAKLIDRKELLQEIVTGLSPRSPIRFSEHLEADGPTMLEHSCRLGLEGIICKRLDLPYRAGRGEHWFKAKCQQSQEFVILGYVPSTAASRAVGALALGYYSDGQLAYAGRVGTGWSAAAAASLYADLNKIKAARPALRAALPAGAEKGVVWTEPRLVCAIEYRDWTHDGLIRQSSFKGLREDKPAQEISLESPLAGKRGSAARERKRAPDSSRPGEVKLTHPERILWPEAGITKQGLADYYADIADWILPHVAGRVLSLLRCPSGTSSKCFFAKHPWAGLDDFVPRVDVGEKAPMIAINGLAGLISLVQAGVVEIHPWGSRADRLDQPDRLIFDLDPGEDVPWSAVIAAAGAVRRQLASRGLKSFVKTSGGKGLHIVVPVEPSASWAEAKAFAASVAEAMAAGQPDRYVATAAKRARRGRVFIDYLRNDRGSTAVAPYSTRASPQASVSTPLEWDELSEGLRSDHFTVGNVRHRLHFLKRDPWQGFFTVRQRIPVGGT
ncbi:MAG TPA: DNA ligase D [Xanthobacteraceae bacterium]|nr:DNA ligase D [Xanthobacteraceae bacterium]